LLFLQLVAEEGGFAVVCKDRKWTKIATKMGFAPGKAVGSHIRGHYERILNPYNLFLSGDSLRVSFGAGRNLFYFIDSWHIVF
jgi:histone demethylase JARID1